MTSSKTQPAAPPRHRRFQFSLRTLIIVIVLACVGMSCVAVRMLRAGREREAIEAITGIGGTVYYDYQVVAGDEIDPSIVPPGPVWLRRRLGPEFFANVIAVDIRGQEVTDEFIVCLTSFPRLRWLVLRGTEVSDRGLKLVGALHCLRSLTLDGTPVTDDGLKHIAKLTDLQSLGLAHTGITDAGLARLELLTNLEVLDLAGDIGVTDRGMNHVGRLRNLQRLSLRNCELSDAGLAALRNLQKLEVIDLWYTQVTASAIMDFKRRFPAVEIMGPGVVNDGDEGD